MRPTLLTFLVPAESGQIPGTHSSVNSKRLDHVHFGYSKVRSSVGEHSMPHHFLTLTHIFDPASI